MNYPGCKSVLDAFESIKKNSKQEQSPAGEPNDYEIMRQIIIDIERELNGLDIDLLDKVLRDKLAMMPIRNIGEATTWKESWFQAIKMHTEG